MNLSLHSGDQQRPEQQKSNTPRRCCLAGAPRPAKLLPPGPPHGARRRAATSQPRDIVAETVRFSPLPCTGEREQGACVWAHRGKPAAQPWPLWSAAGIPRSPPAAHLPVATVSPCDFCCCAHSIKENIETKRLTRQSSRGSQKPGPGAGKGCPLQSAPGPGPATAEGRPREGASQDASGGRGLLSGTQ